MFSRKSADVELLLDAREREAKALRMTIEVLAEQVEYLRAQLAGTPHFSQVVPGQRPEPVEMEARAYLSEEEEELMALHNSGRISSLELASLERELGISLTDAPSQE